MLSFLKRLFRIQNATIIVTIVLGSLVSLGLLENYYATDKALVALVTLIATQLLVDRLGVISEILDRIKGGAKEYEIELLPRNGRLFQRFASFVDGATEVVIIGIDLNFVATADYTSLEQLLRDGAEVRLLLCSPKTVGQLADAINRHDERNKDMENLVHDHIGTADNTIRVLSALNNECTPGTLEVRARADIPSPSMTFVNPRRSNGRIRVELKLYKKNHSDVPYFILDKRSPWYQVFYNQYYDKLWNDSESLI